MQHRGILGGTRSGKSHFAQDMAWQLGRENVLFVAKATSTDAEMAARIARHQRERPSTWITFEAPLDLIVPLHQHLHCPVILMDCLSLWVANHLMAGDPPDVELLEQDLARHLEQVFSLADHQQQTLILVSNEWD